MKDDPVSSTREALSQAEIVSHAYRPAAAAYCRRLKLVETVNALVPSAMAQTFFPGNDGTPFSLHVFLSKSRKSDT